MQPRASEGATNRRSSTITAIVGATTFVAAITGVIWVLSKEKPGFFSQTQSEAPWPVTTGAELIGAAAIVIAAVSGSWFTGRWAYKSQREQLEAAREQFDAEQHASALSNDREQRTAVAGLRAQRLRDAYSEYLGHFGRARLLAVRFWAALQTQGHSEDTVNIHGQLLEAQGDMTLAATRVQLVASPQLMLEVIGFENDFGHFVSGLVTDDTPKFDLKPHTLALAALTVKVWKVVKELEEGADFSMSVEPGDEAKTDT